MDSMQALANAWFERRHTGAHKARVAAERMCETQTFVDLIQQAYQEWASGAFERIMADGLTCQQQIMAITGALGSPPLAPTATEKEGELRRSKFEGPDPLQHYVIGVLRKVTRMSALPPKADICGATRDVCYGPIADIRQLEYDVIIRGPPEVSLFSAIFGFRRRALRCKPRTCGWVR